MLWLRLFGGPFLEGPDGVVGGRASRGHMLALLALLAGADGRPVTRDKLIGLLWPERDDERARHLLSQSLYLLRGAVGEDAVLSMGDSLRLNPARVRSDLQEFSRALEAGAHEAAVGLYAGPFLDGFYLPASPEFEPWVEGERERLAREYARCLEALAEARAAAGDVAAAVRWWRDLVGHDPYSGRNARRLMEALEASGDRIAAIRHASEHGRLLRDELGTEVDAAVAALADRLRSEAPPAPPTLPTPPPSEAAISRGPTVAADPSASDAGAADPSASDVALPDPEAAAAGESSPMVGSAAPRRVGRRRLAWALAVGALVVLAGIAFAAQPRGERAADIPAIAVLPFSDLGGDATSAYFADGIHEDLLMHLSRIGSLRVISRTSVLPYRDGGKRVKQIGRELGVGYVVEGSVRRDGGRVLITAQLIDARSDHHLWADQYHRDLVDIFAVQGEIAERISSALQVRLTPAEQRRAATPPTGSLTAYDLYLQALDHLRRYDARHAQTGIALLERAIAADSTFALAHARIAGARVVAVELFGDDERRLELALASASRALALDPGLAEAHHALGTVYLAMGDHGEARPALERAIELNPSFAAPATNLAALHARVGEYDLAVRWNRHAARLDPRGLMNLTSLAWGYAVLGLSGQADQAVERLRAVRPELPHPALSHAILVSALGGAHDRAVRESDELVAAYPGDPVSWAVAGHTRILAGDVEGARRQLERGYGLAPTAGWLASVQVVLAYALLETGDEDRARTLLTEYVEHAHTELGAGRASARLYYSLAVAHSLLGERADAIHWFRTLVDGGAGVYRARFDDPLLERLRGDAELERLRAAANARLDAMRRSVERDGL
jgi:TolB-like protein/DNA-binding SARP family transcriptional activator/predicted Zn-dependent protease